MRNLVARAWTYAFAPFMSLRSRDPTKFVDKVAVSNKFELDASELALQYSESDDVISFAKHMIDDHDRLGVEFKAALKEAGVEPPEEAIDVAHAAKYAKLRALAFSTGFDRAYAAEQLEAHEDAVAEFEHYAENGRTPALKAFAAKTMPMLEQHLQMAKTLKEKVNAA